MKKHIAYVDVYNMEDAEKALKLNDVNLKGQKIAVFISKPPALG